MLGISEGKDAAQLDGLTMEQINRYQKILWDRINNRGEVSVNIIECTEWKCSRSKAPICS